MISARVNRWIATHPESSIAAVAMLALFVLRMSATVAMVRSSALRSLVERNLVVAVVLTGGLFAVTVGISFHIVCLRHRAGLPHKAGMWLGAAFRCMLLVTAVCCAVLFVAWIIGEASVSKATFLFAILQGPLTGAYVGLASGLGMALGRRFAQRQIARGRWEVTVPVERPGEQP